MSLIIEISDKILHLQLILALILTAYTYLIVKFVIQQKHKCHYNANFLSLSYCLPLMQLCIVLKKMKMWQNTEESIPKHV